MTSDKEFAGKLLGIRRGVLDLLEEKVFEAGLDPAKASPTLIYDYTQVQTEIETGHIGELTPTDRLAALDKLEKWYSERKVPFPNKKWLIQARQRYSVKK